MTITRPVHAPVWCDSNSSSSDVHVMTSSDWTSGQQSGAPPPNRQFFNGIVRGVHALGMYHLEGGAPEWGSDTPYRVGALVTYAGVLYRCTSAVSAGGANPSSNASWNAVGKFFELVYATTSGLTATTPYTKTWEAGVGVCRVIAIGGGGGGGRAYGGNSSSQYTGGGAGGGGACMHDLWLPVTAGSSWVITFAPGGAGGSQTTNARAQSGAASTIAIGATTYYFAGASGGGYGDNATGSVSVRRSGGAPLAGASTTDAVGTDVPDGYIAAPNGTPGVYSITQVARNGPGVGGYSGMSAAASTHVVTTAQIVGRRGGDYGGNLGGAQGADYGGTTWGEFGGGGGGASNFDAATWQRLAGSTASIVGGAGGVGGNGSTPSTAGGTGVGFGCGGGGGGGGGNGSTTPNDANGGAGQPGAVILQYYTF